MIKGILSWMGKWSLKEMTTTLIALMILWLNLWVFTNVVGWNGAIEAEQVMDKISSLETPLTQQEYIDYIDDYHQTRFGQLKDLLAIATGFLGVILGYYFGRIPAEKALDNVNSQMNSAQENVAAALAKSEAAKAKLQEAAAEIVKLANDPHNSAATNNASELKALAEKLQSE